jgi:glycolate oxidase FAD binding subunit
MNEADVADSVRAAYEAREPLLVQGAGTKACMLRPVQAARSISTAGLCGVSLYAPKELVISAASGTTVAAIEAVLAEAGQHLIAEPPDYAALLGSEGEQTLGGIVATNLSGPRRVAWGATRDHVLGLRAVDGTGAVIRSGGRVLKNVTGLDICKLLTGSHGTLGVITEATLKVLPAPEASGSVLLRGLDPVRGVAALSAALGSPFSVTGAAYLPEDAAGRLPQPEQRSVAIARIEELDHSVTYRIGRLRQALAEFGTAEVLDDLASRAAWTAIRNAQVLPASPGDAIWRISVRPSSGPAMLASAITAGAAGYLDWGGGLVMLAGPASDALHRALTASVLRSGGVWTVMRGPAAWRAATEIVPRETPALAAITRRVKAAMDPRAILNPGRLYAGL